MTTTNEELALKAKAGDQAALLQLWEQNHGLAHIFSVRRLDSLRALGNQRGAEYDDLMQAAFLAMVDAVGYYDPEKEYSFVSYWGRCIKAEYSALLGLRTSKRDPIDCSTSLETPLGDDEDSDVLGDMIPAPGDEYEKADHEIWRAELHATMEKVLAQLTPRQQQALRLRYYDGLSYDSIADQMGVSLNVCRAIEEKARWQIKRPALRRELESFIDEITNFHRIGSGKEQTKPVEDTVIRREWQRERYAPRFEDEDA